MGFRPFGGVLLVAQFKMASCPRNTKTFCGVCVNAPSVSDNTQCTFSYQYAQVNVVAYTCSWAALPAWMRRCSPLSNVVTERRLRYFGHIARSAPDEDHHRAVVAAIRKPPSDWKRPPEDPTTRGQEPLNEIWDHRTSVLPTRGRRQPLENPGVRLWTRLRSRRVCHEERERESN